MTNTTELYDVPPTPQLWAVIREAHDYLHEYINGPSVIDPKYGKVRFDAGVWGESDGNTCTVCLAGLWFVRRVGMLVLEISVSTSFPPLADFLDDLRHPDKDYVRERVQYELGVDVPEDLADELAGGEDEWDGNNPEHILAFLQWLLQQEMAA